MSTILFQPCTSVTTQKSGASFFDKLLHYKKNENLKPGAALPHVQRVKRVSRCVHLIIFINEIELLCAGARVKVIKLLDENAVSYALVQVM